MKRYGFPNTYRLKKKKEIHQVFRSGKRMASKHYVLLYLPNLESNARLAVSASKKIGKSVRRNYEKRLVKEAFRHVSRQIQNFDFVVIITKARHIVDPKIMELETLFNRFTKPVINQ